MAIAVTIAATAFGCWFLFVLLQNLSTGERRIRYEIPATSGVHDEQFRRAMSQLLGPIIAEGNSVRTLQNGKEIFPAMLAAIRQARRSIAFETYIYWSGKIGREFADALSDRARNGVRVHVLLDWLGSSRLDPAAIDEMVSAGVEVEKYRPLHWYHMSRMNSRTHRKILVVDGQIGFTGGVGIADQWLGDADSPAHWRDSHFQVEGPVVAQLQAAFMDNWNKSRPEVLWDESHFPPLAGCGPSAAHVFRSSPREGSSSVRLMYLLAIAAARDHILLANSYFVPDDESIEALIAARQRGVRVEIIVPGKRTDVPILRRASRALWGPLLKAGVEIYEYQPTMFHCKVAVVDGLWVSVGSTNFDNRSFRLNDEANLNVFDRELASEQARIFEADKARSRPITLKAWKRRPRRERFYEACARLLRSQL